MGWASSFAAAFTNLGGIVSSVALLESMFRNKDLTHLYTPLLLGMD